MKSSVKSSYDHMWKELESSLVEFSADNHNEHLPEIKLLCAVVTLAGRDHDDEYFAGDMFIQHCYHLKLHKVFVMSLFKRAWRVEKSGVLWEYTQPLDESNDVD